MYPLGKDINHAHILLLMVSQKVFWLSASSLL